MTMMTYRFAPAFDDEDDDDDGDGDYKDDDDGGVPVWSSLLSGCFSETGRQSSPLRAEKHLVILDHHDNDHHDVIFDHQDYDDVIVDIDDHDYVIVDHHDHDDVILDHHDHDDNDGHDHDDSLDDGDSGDDDFDDQDDHKNDDDDAKNVLNLKQRVEHSVLLDRVGMDTLHNNDYSENDSNCDSESDSNRDKLSLIMVTTTNVMILMRWCWDEPGMSRGWVGIDRLDLLVACQQINDDGLVDKQGKYDDHLYSFFNHLSVRYFPNSSSWNKRSYADCDGCDLDDPDEHDGDRDDRGEHYVVFKTWECVLNILV